jgi:hypothetical protein
LLKFFPLLKGRNVLKGDLLFAEFEEAEEIFFLTVG